MSEWKKIDPFGEFEAKGIKTFLTLDEHGDTYLGLHVFDYYDSMYWHPLPKMPLKEQVITNVR